MKKNTPTTTNATVNETLSAWMDGELDADAAKFLQRRIDNDSHENGSNALADRWSRYHLVGDVLRGSRSDLVVAPVDFSVGVMAAIENESQEAAPVITPEQGLDAAANDSSFWRSSWASLAAVVAVVAVGAALVLPQLDNADIGNANNPTLVAIETNSPVNQTTDSQTTPVLASSVRPMTDSSTGTLQGTAVSSDGRGTAIGPAQLNDMLLQHSEGNQGQSWLPYARMLQTGSDAQNGLNADELNQLNEQQEFDDR